MAKKIKVPGYTEKINYLGDISYRPFNPIVKPMRSDAVFTNGNFSVISNVDKKHFKYLNNTPFSKYYTLSDMGVKIEDVAKVFEKDSTKINFDPSDLSNYSYFGSMKEHLRVTLEEIISNFPAGLVINKNYVEDGILHGPTTSLFDSEFEYLKINLKRISNPYQIEMFETNTELENSTRDFYKNFDRYTIKNGIYESRVKEIFYTREGVEDFLIVKVVKNHSVTTDGQFYIVPRELEREKFFIGLNELGSELLNRNITPKYTYTLKMKEFVDTLGYFLESVTKGTWPVSDGYNLDFNNGEYDEYVSQLIELCDKYDEEKGNLVIRQLVASSILEFDTIPSIDNDNNIAEGQKIKTLLSIYGRSFDETKKYIDGLKLSNVITYDKKNNAPDTVISSIATTLGWNIINPNEFLNFKQEFLTVDNSVKNGLTLTKEEIKKDIFRRLIINSPWLYKMKGTRKAIEFFNNFFDVPEGLVSIDEYVYVVKEKQNYDLLIDLFKEMNEDVDINNIEFLFDENGLPKILPNTQDSYFQMKGRWYQETTGPTTNLEINTGNNPHSGPYDSGSSFLKQFTNLIPNFKTTSRIVTETKDLYKNFYKEDFDIYPKGDAPLIDLTSQTKYDISGIIKEINPPKEVTNDCGCDLIDSTSNTLSIGANVNESMFGCNYDLVNLGDDKIFKFYKNSAPIDPTTECCNLLSGSLIFSHKFNKYICVERGYYECERYRYVSVNPQSYQVFTDLTTSTNTIAVPGPECCVNGATPVPTDGAYLCYVGKDITGKCIRINSIEIQHGISPRPDFSIRYKNASTNKFKTQTHTSIVNGVTNSNITTFGTPVPIELTLGTFPKKTINTSDLIASTGTTVPSFDNHQYTVTDPGFSGTLKLNFSYVDCPPITEEDVCIKFIGAQIVSPLVSDGGGVVTEQNITPILVNSFESNPFKHTYENTTGIPRELYNFNIRSNSKGTWTNDSTYIVGEKGKYRFSQQIDGTIEYYGEDRDGYPVSATERITNVELYINDSQTEVRLDDGVDLELSLNAGDKLQIMYTPITSGVGDGDVRVNSMTYTVCKFTMTQTTAFIATGGVPDNFSLSYKPNLTQITKLFTTTFDASRYIDITSKDNVITSLKESVGMNMNISANQLNASFRLSDFIQYETAEIGNTYKFDVFFPDPQGATYVKFTVVAVECTTCDNYVASGDVVIGGKHYTEFTNIQTSTRTTDVPLIECCPVGTTPEFENGFYKCFTGQTDTPDGCKVDIIQKESVLDYTHPYLDPINYPNQPRHAQAFIYIKSSSDILKHTVVIDLITPPTVGGITRDKDNKEIYFEDTDKIEFANIRDIGGDIKYQYGLITYTSGQSSKFTLTGKELRDSYDSAIRILYLSTTNKNYLIDFDFRTYDCGRKGLKIGKDNSNYVFGGEFNQQHEVTDTIRINASDAITIYGEYYFDSLEDGGAASSLIADSNIFTLMNVNGSYPTTSTNSILTNYHAVCRGEMPITDEMRRFKFKMTIPPGLTTIQSTSKTATNCCRLVNERWTAYSIRVPPGTASYDEIVNPNSTLRLRLYSDPDRLKQIHLSETKVFENGSANFT